LLRTRTAGTRAPYGAPPRRGPASSGTTATEPGRPRGPGTLECAGGSIYAGGFRTRWTSASAW